MTTVFLVNGKVRKQAKGDLEKALIDLFESASATSQGQAGADREIAAKSVLGVLPQINSGMGGKLESVIIDTDEEIINISANGMTELLNHIANAVAANKAFRLHSEPANVTYKAVRNVTVKNPKEGKQRGRPASDPYALNDVNSMLA